MRSGTFPLNKKSLKTGVFLFAIKIFSNFFVPALPGKSSSIVNRPYRDLMQRKLTNRKTDYLFIYCKI